MFHFQMPPKFEILKVLGKGSFGYVFEVLDIKKQQIFALKRTQRKTNKMSCEARLLKQLSEEAHIVKLEEFFYSINDSNDVQQNLVMEYCQTDLEKVLKAMKKGKISLPYPAIKQLLFQTLLGLNAMHKKGICHRDLKPDNILLKDGLVKISDLGFAKQFVKERNNPYVVSRYYRSPELLLGIERYDKGVDIWAFGVIFFEFLFKALPFYSKCEGGQLFQIFRLLGEPSETQLETYKQQMGNKSPVLEKIMELVGEQSKIWRIFDKLELVCLEKNLIKSMLRKCWEYDMKKRATTEELLSSLMFCNMKTQEVVLESTN